MAQVVLDFLYLHDALAPETFLTFDLEEESVSSAVAGEVRRLAGGRRRAILTPGVSRSVPVRLDLVTRTQREALEDWVGEGRFLMLREPRGRVAWGHIFSLEVSEMNLREECSVSFTFEAVTYSEEV